MHNISLSAYIKKIFWQKLQTSKQCFFPGDLLALQIPTKKYEYMSHLFRIHSFQFSSVQGFAYLIEKARSVYIYWYLASSYSRLFGLYNTVKYCTILYWLSEQGKDSLWCQLSSSTWMTYQQFNSTNHILVFLLLLVVSPHKKDSFIY